MRLDILSRNVILYVPRAPLSGATLGAAIHPSIYTVFRPSMRPLDHMSHRSFTQVQSSNSIKFHVSDAARRPNSLQWRLHRHVNVILIPPRSREPTAKITYQDNPLDHRRLFVLTQYALTLCEVLTYICI